MANITLTNLQFVAAAELPSDDSTYSELVTMLRARPNEFAKIPLTGTTAKKLKNAMAASMRRMNVHLTYRHFAERDPAYLYVAYMSDQIEADAKRAAGDPTAPPPPRTGRRGRPPGSTNRRVNIAS